MQENSKLTNFATPAIADAETAEHLPVAEVVLRKNGGTSLSRLHFLLLLGFITCLVAAGATVGGTFAAGVWGTAKSNDNSTLANPSLTPTGSPTKMPSEVPSTSPTASNPTSSPWTSSPSSAPSRTPSGAPQTSRPSRIPTRNPTTSNPSQAPTSSKPSRTPSKTPTTSRPSRNPSRSPSRTPSTSRPSRTPSQTPSRTPSSSRPTLSPTSSRPSISPSTMSPTMNCATINYDFQIYGGYSYNLFTSPSLVSNGVTLYGSGNTYICQDPSGLSICDGSITAGFPALRGATLDYGEQLGFGFQYGAKNVQFYLSGVGGGGGSQSIVIDSYDQYGALISTSYATSPSAGSTWTVNGNGLLKRFMLRIGGSYPSLYVRIGTIRFQPLSC